MTPTLSQRTWLALIFCIFSSFQFTRVHSTNSQIAAQPVKASTFSTLSTNIDLQSDHSNTDPIHSPDVDNTLRITPTPTIPVDELTANTYTQLIAPHLTLVPFITLPLGLLLCFYGTRLLSVHRLLTGFIVSTLSAFLIHTVFFRIYQVEDYDLILVNMTCLAIGAIGALLFLCFPTLTHFSLAIIAGMLVGSMINSVVLLLLASHITFNPLYTLLLFVAVGVATTLFINGITKQSDVLHTALIGSWLTVRSVSTWIGGWETEFQTKPMHSADDVNHIHEAAEASHFQSVDARAFSIYLVVVLVLTVVGVWQQYRNGSASRDGYEEIRDEHVKTKRSRLEPV